MFVQLRRQTHEIRSGFNDVIRDAERDIELEKIKELKSKLDGVKDGKVVETAIKDAVVKDDSYHDSHYVDGEYKKHNKEDGYVNADELLAKAKERDAEILRPKPKPEEEASPAVDSSPAQQEAAPQAAPAPGQRKAVSQPNLFTTTTPIVLSMRNPKLIKVPANLSKAGKPLHKEALFQAITS